MAELTPVATELTPVSAVVLPVVTGRPSAATGMTWVSAGLFPVAAGIVPADFSATYFSAGALLDSARALQYLSRVPEDSFRGGRLAPAGERQTGTTNGRAGRLCLVTRERR